MLKEVKKLNTVEVLDYLKDISQVCFRNVVILARFIVFRGNILQLIMHEIVQKNMRSFFRHNN